jgi:hypothetical protein
MQKMIAFLKEQWRRLMETAKRCPDPKTAAELVSVAEMLHAKAEELRPGH